MSLNKNRRNIVDNATSCGSTLTSMGSPFSSNAVHLHRQAISTGLVASCVVCRGRPRRTGERVCGRTCGERERQSRQIQGSYYGVPVVRREPRTRPGP